MNLYLNPTRPSRPTRSLASHLLAAISLTLTLTLGSAAPALAQATTPAPAPAAPAPTDDQIIQLGEYRVTAMREFSDFAIPEKTPISFVEISSAELDVLSVAQDAYFTLQDTPSFFIADNGGGFGDSYYTLRGFSQRNVGNMLNGIPVNDLESGQYYSSNWANVRDIASVIQVQRGVSNITLTIPSIGGTVNTILNPASNRPGLSLKFSAGNNATTRESITANTGLLAGKFAATVSFSNYYTRGPRDGLYARAQGYYAGLSYKINDTNTVELYAVAAPQIHGQTVYPTNLANYSASYARKLGYTDAQLACFPEFGMRYNSRYSPVDPSYTGKQYYWGRAHNRFMKDGISMGENYYAKPQVNLTWFSKLSRKADLGITAFYLGGSGGGTGTAYFSNAATSAVFAYIPYAAGATTQALPYDWNRVIQVNSGNATYNNNTQQLNAPGGKTAGQSWGVLRNSVNSGNQYGLVAKLAYAVSKNLKLTAGADWRTSAADHYYEVRDLLGGQYYIPTTAQANDLDITYPQGTPTVTKRLGLGDKFNYNYTGYVNWLGGFLSADYTTKKTTSFLTAGYGITDYSSINHFKHNTGADGWLDPSSEVKTTAPRYNTKQVKAGFRYELASWCSPYANAGWASRAPILSAAIDGANSVLTGAPNETFTTCEAGINFKTKNKKLTTSVNYYWTQWRNQSRTSLTLTSNPPTRTEQNDVSANYGGLEFDAKYNLTTWLRLTLSGAFSNWYYCNNSIATVYNENTHEFLRNDIAYIKSLKVSNAPQTQISYGLTLRPVKDLSITIKARWMDRYYSDYNVFSRTGTADTTQAWRIPAATLCDLNINYWLPIRTLSGERSRVRASLYLNIRNLFNTLAISSATDNYYYDNQTAYAPAHSVQRAEVNLYVPLSIDGGIKISF